MPRSGDHGWLPLAGLALALAGCSAPPPPAYPEWATKSQTFAPSPSSENAYDGYVLAARQAEGDAGDLASFVSFEGRHKAELITRVAPALRLVRQASKKICGVKFEPRDPLSPNPNHAGLRLIRSSIVWQIESALAKDDLDTAANLAVLATKVGFDLAGGDASDADVGLQFADEARRAIAPRLPDLSQAQLSRLTQGLKGALSTLPSFQEIAKHEEQNYLCGVDNIQAFYRANAFVDIENGYGSSVREAVSYLKGIKGKDREERPAYFQGFAKEAQETASWYGSQSALPTVKRKAPKDMPLAEHRPWKRFSAVLFTTLRPVLNRYDATLARTRLLILTCEIHRQIKAARVAPKTLDAFTSDLATDPYSGRAFQYRADGMEFYLYSVGSNFQDDQGSTDSIYTNPDLQLETSRR